MKPGIYLWRGREYVGQKAVAAAAGVTAHTVSALLNRHGDLSQLGVGRGNHRGQRRGGDSSIPVERFGRRWPSRTAMAADLGVALSTVQRWVATGDDDRILAALMAADARRTAAALEDADMIDRIGKVAA